MSSPAAQPGPSPDASHDSLLCQIMASLREGCWLWDANTGHLAWGPGCFTLLGHENNAFEISWATWQDLIYPADRAVFEQARLAWDRGEPGRGEFRMRCKDDRWIWVTCRGVVISGETPGHSRIGGMISNITPRKDREAQQEKAETRSRLLMTALPDLLMVINTAGFIEEYRPPAEGYASYLPAEQIVGQPYETVLPTPSIEPITQAIMGLLADGRPRHLDIEFPMREGLRPFHLTMTAVVDGQDVPDGYLCLARDLSEQRHHDRFQHALMDALPSQIAVIDAQGKIIATNTAWNAFSRRHGRSFRPAVGDNYLTALRSALETPFGIEAEAAIVGLVSVLEGSRQFFRIDYPLALDGQEYWFAMKITPFGNGERGAVVAHEDLSERHRLDQETQKLYQRFHTLADALPGGVFQYRIPPDGPGFVSYAAGEVFISPSIPTASADHPLGSLLVSVLGEDRRALIDALEDAGRQHASWQGQFRVRRGDNIRWMQGSAAFGMETDGTRVLSGQMVYITPPLAPDTTRSTSDSPYPWVKDGIGMGG